MNSNNIHLFKILKKMSNRKKIKQKKAFVKIQFSSIISDGNNNNKLQLNFYVPMVNYIKDIIPQRLSTQQEISRNNDQRMRVQI